MASTKTLAGAGIGLIAVGFIVYLIHLSRFLGRQSSR